MRIILCRYGMMILFRFSGNGHLEPSSNHSKILDWTSDSCDYRYPEVSKCLNHGTCFLRWIPAVWLATGQFLWCPHGSS